MDVKINVDEGVDDLQLNGLKLIQKQQGFRFGVDAVLLSHFANIKSRHRVIDLCTGTGIVPFLAYGKYAPKEVIGLEIQEDTDQFIYIVQGEALVQLGETQCPNRVACNNAILVPAGTWHNVINIGNTPLKLYSLYAPSHHTRGTLHRTKCDAERDVY